MIKNGQEVIKECLKKRRMTQTAMASLMKVDRRNLNQKLNRSKDIKTGEFAKMLDLIGFDVEIVEKKDSQNIPKNQDKKIP